jgi:hypothetical protein
MYSEKTRLTSAGERIGRQSADDRHDVTGQIQYVMFPLYAETFVNAGPVDLEVFGERWMSCMKGYFLPSAGRRTIEDMKLEAILKACHRPKPT